MRHTIKQAAAFTATVFLAAGCVQRAPVLENQMGQSLSLIKAQQILNPAAVRNADPGSGMDAKAAKSGYDEYQKSYRVPAPPSNAFTIGIGGGR